MLLVHYIASPCQALDVGEKVAGERLPAAAQPASLAMGLGRWFAYGCLACPDNFCCLEDLSSLGQAQLIFSEFPVNKGKDMAYVTPLLVGSLASSRTAACPGSISRRGGGLAVPSLPLSHPLGAILSKPFPQLSDLEAHSRVRETSRVSKIITDKLSLAKAGSQCMSSSNP